jgi:hypothetical protein
MALSDTSATWTLLIIKDTDLHSAYTIATSKKLVAISRSRLSSTPVGMPLLVLLGACGQHDLPIGMLDVFLRKLISFESRLLGASLVFNPQVTGVGPFSFRPSCCGLDGAGTTLLACEDAHEASPLDDNVKVKVRKQSLSTCLCFVPAPISRKTAPPGCSELQPWPLLLRLLMISLYIYDKAPISVQAPRHAERDGCGR